MLKYLKIVCSNIRVDTLSNFEDESSENEGVNSSHIFMKLTRTSSFTENEVMENGERVQRRVRSGDLKFY